MNSAIKNSIVSLLLLALNCNTIAGNSKSKGKQQKQLKDSEELALKNNILLIDITVNFANNKQKEACKQALEGWKKDFAAVSTQNYDSAEIPREKPSYFFLKTKAPLFLKNHAIIIEFLSIKFYINLTPCGFKKYFEYIKQEGGINESQQQASTMCSILNSLSAKKLIPFNDYNVCFTTCSRWFREAKLN